MGPEAKQRDLTRDQFLRRLDHYGFTPEGFMGYYRLPGSSVCVSALNGGRRRRDQLAYLLAKLSLYGNGQS